MVFYNLDCLFLLINPFAYPIAIVFLVEELEVTFEVIKMEEVVVVFGQGGYLYEIDVVVEGFLAEEVLHDIVNGAKEHFVVAVESVVFYVDDDIGFAADGIVIEGAEFDFAGLEADVSHDDRGIEPLEDLISVLARLDEGRDFPIGKVGGVFDEIDDLEEVIGIPTSGDD